MVKLTYQFKSQVFDSFLTFDQEIEAIWTRKWNPIRVLYVLTRYSAFLEVGVTLYRMLLPNLYCGHCFNLINLFCRVHSSWRIIRYMFARVSNGYRCVTTPHFHVSKRTFSLLKCDPSVLLAFGLGVGEGEYSAKHDRLLSGLFILGLLSIKL